MAKSNSTDSELSYSRAEHSITLADTDTALHTRTWLLPTNRKLRNVEFIALRNVSLVPSSPPRKRGSGNGKAIDDEALPHALKSPAKMVALREQRTLGHSRSSTDLRAVAENGNGNGNGNGVVETDTLSSTASADAAAKENGSPAGKKEHGRSKSALTGSPNVNANPHRPSQLRPRRRSTLEWSNATPQRRQERLEDVTRERMADIFFTLHLQGTCIQGWWLSCRARTRARACRLD